MENLSKKPSKGILKSSSSFEQQNECQSHQKIDQSTDKDIKWDEMNILQTLHPADKDYGHMKIEEPKTPYNYYSDNTDGEQLSDHETHGLDANTLADNIARKAKDLPKVLKSDSESEESDDENLTEDEKKKKREFEVKRKMHYNEFQAVKLARKLLEEEDDDEDEVHTSHQSNTSINTTQSADNEDNTRNGNHSKDETTGNEQIDCEDIDSVENR